MTILDYLILNVTKEIWFISLIEKIITLHFFFPHQSTQYYSCKLYLLNVQDIGKNFLTEK